MTESLFCGSLVLFNFKTVSLESGDPGISHKFYNILDNPFSIADGSVITISFF